MIHMFLIPASRGQTQSIPFFWNVDHNEKDLVLFQASIVLPMYASEIVNVNSVNNR